MRDRLVKIENGQNHFVSGSREVLINDKRTPRLILGHNRDRSKSPLTGEQMAQSCAIAFCGS